MGCPVQRRRTIVLGRVDIGAGQNKPHRGVEIGSSRGLQQRCQIGALIGVDRTEKQGGHERRQKPLEPARRIARVIGGAEH
jgi:hypothetical protein